MRDALLPIKSICAITFQIRSLEIFEDMVESSLQKYLPIESYTDRHIPVRLHCFAMTTAGLPHGTMELNHIGATRFYMKSINVLRHNNRKPNKLIKNG